MTRKEVEERYQIPSRILNAYESWNLCSSVKQVMTDREYDDQDIEWLSLVMTLHDIGFSEKEIESYMHLYLSAEDTTAERLAILNKRRSLSLHEIHFKERQLDRLDYLRHEIRKSKYESEWHKDK